MARISKAERRKVAFIREYRALCERHQRMIVMSETITDEEGEEWRLGDPGVEVDPDRYLAFCVADISNTPGHLASVIEEMLIEDVMEIETE